MTQLLGEEFWGPGGGLSGEGLRFFGVWDVTPWGDCRCLAGADCRAAGKHPMPGFPRGFKDAVSAEEWAGLAPAVWRVGGRAAAAVPGRLWVLDVDSGAGWRGFLALVARGALPASAVLAVARTGRGWHVWFRPAAVPAEGWTGKAAGRAVVSGLRAVDMAATTGLDVKSAGGYVVWPAGGERFWVSLEVFRGEVEFGLVGWQRRQGGEVEVLGSVLPEEAYAAGTPTGELGRNVFADEYAKLLGAGLAPAGYMEEMRAVTMADLLEQVSVGAPAGARNETLNAVAWRWGRNAVQHGNSVKEVSGLLVEWGARMGLGIGEVRATVKSGLGLSGP